MDNQPLKTAREKFGLFFREIRKKQGLTQQQVGEICGVSLQTINKIELGKYPYSVDLLLKLSTVLGFTINFEAKEILEYSYDIEIIDNTVKVSEPTIGMICTFERGKFNSTQVFVFTKKNNYTSGELATIMRALGDWLYANYSELL